MGLKAKPNLDRAAAIVPLRSLNVTRYCRVIPHATRRYVPWFRGLAGKSFFPSLCDLLRMGKLSLLLARMWRVEPKVECISLLPTRGKVSGRTGAVGDPQIRMRPVGDP
jgi:hypothetical protein